jgi:hypothetical protein
MPSSLTKTRKTLVACVLILAAGLLGLMARPAESKPVALPDVAPAFAAAHLQVVAASGTAGVPGRYRQWTVEDSSGERALVYVEATREPQRVLEWTGQLGFQGEGYQVGDAATRSLTATGAGGQVSTAYLTGPGGQLAMAATDLGPDGLSRGGVWAAPRLLLDEVGGRQGLWFLVRVTIVSGGGADTNQATQLLAAMVPALSQARTGQN